MRFNSTQHLPLFCLTEDEMAMKETGRTYIIIIINKNEINLERQNQSKKIFFS